MSDNPPMVDIFILALIAAFIALRLRSVLGRRTDDDESRQGSGTVIEMQGIRGQNSNGIAAVMAADPGFEPNAFVNGAKTAFSMIVNAFRIGDTATLRPLVSDEVFTNFVKALEDQSLEQVQVLAVLDAEILEAALVGSSAEITVQFSSDQELRGQVSRVVDIWTFRRKLRSPDPTWILVATRAVQA